MSRCLDTVDCENLFNGVVKKVGSIMDFNVHYMGSLNGSSVDCKHGSDECKGNTQQLCATYFYQNENTWWDFIVCVSENYVQIPNNGEQCASQLGMNWDILSNCTEGLLGLQLLIESVKKYTNTIN